MHCLWRRLRLPRIIRDLRENSSEDTVAARMAELGSTARVRPKPRFADLPESVGGGDRCHMLRA
ncbi:hypothetical protein GCM10009555_040910 [Acrocarpospora macrocephala]|uniref:Uncharacterized protein n=1 Tax=Acrocarpospora macrocephala TaxID=150177 RepID=A0A5M3WKY6_9ACTN|nr:hypothetical protein Amac_035330 [Acrocarpospora macrocephala]